jgi:hypothetical protein
VTLSGANFAQGTTVYFGGVPATVTALSSTQMTVIAPAGSGSVSVWAATFGQDSYSLGFTYLEPTVTSTPTVTATPTPTPLSEAVIYPNPSDGSVPAQICVPVRAVTDVKIKIYTMSFRKVQELDFSSLAPPQPKIILPFLDKWGTQLANGLYYVQVLTDQGGFTVKWLILR